MAARKLTLEAVNARLKAGCIGVSVLRRGDRLWLQATLPPKPGAKRNYEHQQQVPLGIYANPDGLKEAENHAIEMGALIARGTFRWIEFNTGVQGTCQAWASRYQTYLKDNKLKGDKDFQWRENYWNPALKWLPRDQALTDEAVIVAAQHYPANSRARQLCCQVLSEFAKFCELQVDLKPYKGTYSSRKTKEKYIPTDEEIITGRECLTDRADWPWVFGMMAAYGLRPHECWHVESIEEIDGVLVVNIGENTKTGAHIVRPLHPKWAEQWQLSTGGPPLLTVRENKEYGERTARHFKRKKVSFAPYSLRHGYAIRGSVVYRIPVPVMARMMGHSPEVHLRTYDRWVSGETEAQAYLEAIKHFSI